MYSAAEPDPVADDGADEDCVSCGVSCAAGCWADGAQPATVPASDRPAMPANTVLRIEGFTAVSFRGAGTYRDRVDISTFEELSKG